jgi:hypothetical protein
MRFRLLLLLTALPWTLPASAQTRISRPAASLLFATGQENRSPSWQWAEPDTTKHIRATYWKEGALIGGVIGALSGAYLGYGLCQDSDSAHGSCFLSAVGGALGVALVLGVPGALIGGSFEKAPVDSVIADSMASGRAD